MVTIATTLRFVLLGDDRASQAFHSLERSVDRTNRAMSRNQSAMRRQSQTQASLGKSTGGLIAHITGIGDAVDASSRKASIFRRVLAGIGLATGIAESSVSALVVAAGGLAAAYASAGAGLAAYSVALRPLLTQTQAVTKAQQQLKTARQSAQAAYNAALASGASKQAAAAARTRALTAAQDKYRQALKGIPQPVRRFAGALKDAQDTWTHWADSLAKPVLAPLTKALSFVRPILNAITPLTKAAAGALGTLADQLGAKIGGGGLQRVVTVLLPHVRPTIISLGHTIANVTSGVFGLIKAFLPFSGGILRAVEHLTARFRDWANTLSSHSGFQALVSQWKQNWPVVREGLGHLLRILVNVGKAMAGIATPSNSRSLWQVANPLLALAERASEHPALLQALLYMLAIGKGAGQIKGVFAAMKSGWGTFSKVIGFLTGGKIQLGMQAAGDTMLVAARQMQVAADTMAGASLGGKGGGVPVPGGKGGGRFGRVLGRLGGTGATIAGLGGGGAVIASAVGIAAPIAAAWFIAHDPAAKASQRQAARELKVNHLTATQVAINRLSGPQAARQAGPGRSPIGDWHQYDRAGAAAKRWSRDVSAAVQNVTATQARLRDSMKAVDATFSQQFQRAQNARNGLNAYDDAVRKTGQSSLATRSARRTLIGDLEQAGVKSSTARHDVNAYNNAVKNNGISSDQARAARRRLVNDISDAVTNSRRGRREVTGYTQAVRSNGDTAAQARSARRNLIRDLMNAGLSAKEARNKVSDLTQKILAGRAAMDRAHHTSLPAMISDLQNLGKKAGFSRGQVATMISKILGIPKRRVINIIEHGNATYNVQRIALRRHALANARLPQGAGGLGLAAGGKLPGFGGGDQHLRLLESGEAVVDKYRTRRYAPVLKAMGVPGMAAGGRVGYRDGLPGLGNFTQARDKDFLRQVTRSLAGEMDNALVAAMRAAAKRAQAALAAATASSGALGGDASKNRALARRIFPWGASQWPAFVSLEMREAGFNRFARNPSSGAYGIPQALPPSKLPFAGQAAGGSHAGPQLSWMFSYIRGRYGTPAAAWGHEQRFNWYRKGTGGAAPGWRIVGERGPELEYSPRGGETILPSHHPATRAAARLGVPGYAKGTRHHLTAKQKTHRLIEAGMRLARSLKPGDRFSWLQAAMAALHRDRLLSHARGLRRGTRRHYAALAASAGHRVHGLSHELAALRAYRGHLESLDASDSATMRAAKHQHLAREAARLGKLIAARRKRIERVNLRTVGHRHVTGGSSSGSGAGTGGTKPLAPITVKDVTSAFARYFPAVTYGFAGGGQISEPIAGLGLRTGAGYSFGEHGGEYVASNADMKAVSTLLGAILAELRAQGRHVATGPERTGQATAKALNSVSRRVSLGR